MRRVFIVVVNGMAQSGKTTIQNKAVELAKDDVINASVEIASSVEVPYKVMRILGWNGIKDDMFRADMAEIKQMYIRHCNGPVTDLIRLALDRATEGICTDHIIFSDMREASEIKKVIKLTEALKIVGIECKTVMIRRDSADAVTHGNASDDSILDTQSIISYDIICDNNGTIDSITAVTMDLIDRIIGGSGNGEHSGYAADRTGTGRTNGTGDGFGRAIIETSECG